jgi:hypothetical protein
MIKLVIAVRPTPFFVLDKGRCGAAVDEIGNCAGLWILT